ncbi:AAA family ATPase [Halopseudomonas sp. Lyrl_26]|uniref:AAA family ATPase n=1 Tax=Halopseudomonas sp. Lyrl_26 TaxID=3110923 RepID=UPI003F7D5DB5
MKNDIHDLGLVLDSRVRLIVIESWEELRVLEAIATLAVKRSQTWYTWNQVEGLQRLGFGTALDASEDMSDPEHALDYIRRQNEPALFVFCDLHPFMQSPRVVRLLKMIAMNPEEQAPTLLLVSHELPLPPELRRLAARISLSMPSDEQLAAIIREEAARWTARNQGRRVRTDNRTLEQVVRNLRGVTHEEARLLARKLIVDDGAITQEDLPVLNQAKFSLLDMQGVLSFEQDTARFAEVGGLARFKRWLQERQAAFNDGGRADAPRGVLLAGVQGSGKSLAARAVAGLWGLPLLRLDFAALYNKYIGETEKNLREALAMADAMQPCVLWIDEIEKGLADDGSDQGVSRRVLGTLLTWMAERRSRVFLVATANNVAQLPAELIRKGRLDELFFVDLPAASVREDIFRIHLSRRELTLERFDLPALAAASEGFSGAEIEQAVVAAVYSAAARQEEVVNQHVLEALSETSPLSVVMAERVQALRAWARERAVMAD